MTTDKHAKRAARGLAARTGISYTAARRRLAAGFAQEPPDRAVMLAGLVARSQGKFTTEEFADRLERGGERYAAYLTVGHEAAIEALEYAVAHGVEAVDADLAAVAADRGQPIGVGELAEALRRVRDHSLVLDGSTAAETAYWVADRYWMHRWNNAAREAAPGEWAEVVGPHARRRLALHEWMAPGNDDLVPGL
ncbi:hypothetical protein [Streptomyces xiamenensis]|uniref:hypothetical protein n=1 Tax=Streptomyces xiamenensis TaxID=408015 RepID=UPI0035D7F788